MTSPGIKRLRILTGKHVGACLDLEPGEHSIGPDHDFDITITDWAAPAVRLRIGAGADALASWCEPAADVAGGPAAAEPVQRTQALVEFHPRAFADIVVCIGPVEADWPSDMELLGRAFRPVSPPKPEPRKSHVALRKASAFVISVGFVLSAAVWASMSFMQASSQAADVAPDSPARVEQSLREAAARIGGVAIKVASDHGALVVTGLLETREQAHELRDAIAALPHTVRVSPRFSVVQELIEGIRSGAGLADAQVKHMGSGVFLFTAEAPNPEATRAAIDRLALDLAPAVKRIDVSLEQTAAKTAAPAAQAGANAQPGPLLSAFSDGDVSVVQTRDGAKHLVMSKQDPNPAGP
jgi:type III secretion protein D